MYQIIAPTLFQKKICLLPGIGTLVVVTQPAKTDFVNSSITAPTETINFIEVTDEKIFNEFSAMSELLQKALDDNGSFLLNGIGTFTKGIDEKIRFTPITVDPVFTPVVTAEIVARQGVSHAMLVGDQQTTNLEMTEILEEKQPESKQWELWAIVLAVLAIGGLLFYFYHYGFKCFGNVTY